jgi:hypothetical protein
MPFFALVAIVMAPNFFAWKTPAAFSSAVVETLLPFFTVRMRAREIVGIEKPIPVVTI